MLGVAETVVGAIKSGVLRPQKSWWGSECIFVQTNELMCSFWGWCEATLGRWTDYSIVTLATPIGRFAQGYYGSDGSDGEVLQRGRHAQKGV